MIFNKFSFKRHYPKTHNWLSKDSEWEQALVIRTYTNSYLEVFSFSWNRFFSENSYKDSYLTSLNAFMAVVLSHREFLSVGIEAATRVVQWKKVFLQISQILQENTCVGVSF